VSFFDSQCSYIILAVAWLVSLVKTVSCRTAALEPCSLVLVLEWIALTSSRGWFTAGDVNSSYSAAVQGSGYCDICMCVCTELISGTSLLYSPDVVHVSLPSAAAGSSTGSVVLLKLTPLLHRIGCFVSGTTAGFEPRRVHRAGDRRSLALF